MPNLLQRLNVRHPIFLAPLGGGPSTPELVAAVSNSDGLGAIALAYSAPDHIRDTVRRTRQLTAAPFAINLFAGGWPAHADFNPGPILRLLAPLHASLGIPAPAAPVLAPDPFPAQFEAVLELRPAAFSFTFGIPPRGAIDRLRSANIVTIGTATTLHEALLLRDAGIDAAIAQGSEAGAHRGTFASSFDEAMIPTLDLVRAIAPHLPVVASGGIMDGRDIRRMLSAGASAAQLGTAFLVTPESGAPAIHKEAILAATTDTTLLTRAFSGRPARGIRNTFIDLLDGGGTLGNHADAILPYPLQNSLTRPLRSAAAQLRKPEYLNLWAGQGLLRARCLPAAELFARLVEEMR